MSFNFEKILSNLSSKIDKKVQGFDYSHTAFFNLVKEFIEENPEATNEEVSKFIEVYLDSIYEETPNFYMVKNDVRHYNCYTAFKNNPRIFDKYFDKYINDKKEYKKYVKDEDDPIYTANNDECYKYAMLELIHCIKGSSNENSKRVYKEFEELSLDKQLKMLEENPDFEFKYRVNDEVERNGERSAAKFCVNFLQGKFEDYIKEELIANITTVICKLDEIASLDQFIAKQNKSFRLYHLDQLQIEKKSKIGEEGLYAKYSKDNLYKMSVDKLTVLDAFWTNRYIKEISRINDASFAIKDFDLINIIRNTPRDENGDVIINFSENEKRFLCSKNAIITNIVKRIFADIRDNAELEELESIKMGNNKAYSFQVDRQLGALKLQIGKKYDDYFKNLLPNSNNDILSDIERCQKTQNVISNLYVLKDSQVLTVLENLYVSSSMSDNWGIMFEDMNQDISKVRKVLLGVDIEGFNMPLRLHVNKNDLIDFLKTKNGNSIMRVYDGSDDYIIDNRLLSTNVLFPFSKKQVAYLKSNSPKGTYYTPNYIEHLNYLANNRNYPEHLKEVKTIERIEKKKNKKHKIHVETRVRPNVRYVDLESGIVYNKGIDDTYKEIKGIQDNKNKNNSKNNNNNIKKYKMELGASKDER